MKLEPRCPICEARGCLGHGPNEKETKALSLNIPIGDIVGVRKPRLKSHIVFRTLEEHGPATVDLPLNERQRQLARIHVQAVDGVIESAVNHLDAIPNDVSDDEIVYEN